MKTISIKHGVVGIALLALALLTPLASAQAAVSWDDLPFSANNIVPGATMSGTITLENDLNSGTFTGKITGSAASQSDLSSVLELTVGDGVTTYFDDTLEAFFAQGALLGTIGEDDEKTYTLTISFPSNASDALMGTSVSFNLCAGFAGDTTQCGAVFVPPSSNNSSSSGTRVGSRSGAPHVLGAQTENASCPEYLTGYIRPDGNNSAEEVRKLQQFLRDLGGFSDLAVTGTYDSATIAAVLAFQTRYSSDILLPWGAAEPTGFVYYTTRKTINEIYCAFSRTFPLSSTQLAEIERMRALGLTFTPTFNSGDGPSAPTGTAPNTTPEGGVDGEVAGVQTEVGAPSEGGLFHKIWRLLNGLFGG